MNEERKYDFTDDELSKYKEIGSYGSNYGDIDELESQNSEEEETSKIDEKTGAKKSKKCLSITALIVSLALGISALTAAVRVKNNIALIEKTGVVRAISDSWVQDSYEASANYLGGKYYGHLDLNDFLYDGAKEEVSIDSSVITSPVGYLLDHYVFNEGKIDGKAIVEEIENMEKDGYFIEYVKVGDEIYTKDGGETYVKATKAQEVPVTKSVTVDENGREKVNYSLPSGGVLVGNKGYKYNTIFVKLDDSDVDLPDGYNVEQIVVSKSYSEFDEINYSVEDGEATYTLKMSR